MSWPPTPLKLTRAPPRDPTPAHQPTEEASVNLSRLIRDMSILLAERGLSILEPAQVYMTPDGASGRSDHASFHDRHYPACVTSEDFFPSPGVPGEANP